MNSKIIIGLGILAAYYFYSKQNSTDDTGGNPGGDALPPEKPTGNQGGSTGYNPPPRIINQGTKTATILPNLMPVRDIAMLPSADLIEPGVIAGRIFPTRKNTFSTNLSFFH